MSLSTRAASGRPISSGRYSKASVLDSACMRKGNRGVSMYGPGQLPGAVRPSRVCPHGCPAYYRKQEIFPRTNLLAALNLTNVLDQRYFTGTLRLREVVYTGAPFTVTALFAGRDGKLWSVHRISGDDIPFLDVKTGDGRPQPLLEELKFDTALIGLSALRIEQRPNEASGPSRLRSKRLCIVGIKRDGFPGLVGQPN